MPSARRIPSPAHRRRPVPRSIGIALLSALLAAAACGGMRQGTDRNVEAPSSSVTWNRLRFEVRLLPGDLDRLRAVATVTNETARHRTVQVPWCLVRLRIYDEVGLAYDQDEDEGCAGMVRVLDLASNASESRSVTVPASDVARTSPEPREFTVAAYLPRSSARGDPPRAEMEFVVGRVRLARPDSTAP